MNKKGFTLVEVSMVVLMLAAISLIAVPIVRTVIDNSKQRAYNVNINTIEAAAKSFFMKNYQEYDEDISSNGFINIQIDLLKDEGFIDSDLQNPLNEQQIQGQVRVTKTGINNYTYEYISN